MLKHEIKNEKDCFKKMATLLEEDVQDIDVDIDAILEFLSRAGLILVPKIRKMIVWSLNKAMARQLIRMVVKGPRGGGKTYGIAAGIEFPLFYFFDYDCVNLGGSRAQADKAYEIVQEFIQDPDVSKNIESSVKQKTKKKNGTWMAVLATSGTSVRSPHAGNPNKGGLLFIDEECEIQDERIVKSAKPVVNTAKPSAIIRASTQHKLDDSFEHVWDNAKEQGYTRFKWDIFDACETCTRKCNVSINDDPVNGCYDELRKDTYDDKGNVIKKGYCKGRAHHDGYIYKCHPNGKWTKTYKKKYDWKDAPEGWITMEEIFQDYIENDSETFEVEYLGRKAKRKGKVYPADKIDNSVLDDYQLDKGIFKKLSKSIGVDWGYSNECCVLYSFFYGKKIFIYRVEYDTHASLEYTTKEIGIRAEEENHEDAFGDAEGAYENAALADYVNTFSVAFSLWKDFGVKNFRNFLEKDNVRILRRFNGEESPGVKKFLEQLKGYRYDANGNYVKKNDHGPDAALCNALKWARKRKDLKGKRNKLNNNQPAIHLI